MGPRARGDGLAELTLTGMALDAVRKRSGGDADGEMGRKVASGMG